MKIKEQVPNLLTAGNLVCGCWGIIAVISGEVEMAPVAVLLAAVFDFFDGFAARMLKVSSAIGKELDSLADMVSFGVLPAFTVYQLLLTVQSNQFLPYVAFLIAVFSAFRLAQFNIDTRQSDKFIGVPTPASALFFTTLVWASKAFPELTGSYVLVFLTVLFSWLMVSPFEMIALKFKSFGWAGNQPRYLVIVMAMLVIVVGGYTLVPLVILLYVLISVLSHIFRSKSGTN